MPEGENGKNTEELLKTLNLNLTAEQVENLKSNPDIIDVLTHNINAKRDANQEAKTYREKLEAIQAEQEAQKKLSLEKQGEFQKLYEETKVQLTSKDEKLKQIAINSKIEIKAISEGLKNADYIKLFDVSKLDIDDNFNIKNLDDEFKSFKEKHLELFSEVKSKVNVDSSKPGIKKSLDDTEELKILRLQAEKTKLPKDLARYIAKEKELKQKGKI